MLYTIRYFHLVVNISKLFMPPDSTDRFLIAPVRAVRSLLGGHSDYLDHLDHPDYLDH